MAFAESVTIPVLSVSAPVPAVVGIVISFGNAFSLAIFGAVCSNSKSQRSKLLLAVKQIALPPSIALPPPIAIIASCLPLRNAVRPAPISVSIGLGEISKNNADFKPDSPRNDCRREINSRLRLPRSVTISGFLMPSTTHLCPISDNRPGPYAIGTGKPQSCGASIVGS
ncbi:unannotated protein [freshwater metagenome]|uniref:Unannotated protein n=1 Tax=freshwater metagenome TaxID=449393 RepID=A0A6J6MI14_9ZZZZ